MNPSKLRRLRRKLEQLRRQSKGGIPSVKLEHFAKALGRTRHKRGSEPTWVSPLLGSRPISIPHHSRQVKPFTAVNILDALELDIITLEEKNENDKRQKESNQDDQHAR